MRLIHSARPANNRTYPPPKITPAAQLEKLVLDFVGCVMFPRQEIFAEIGANGKVFLTGVDFCLETLVIIHEQFDARDVFGFLRRLHVSDEVVHPQHQVADHAEEPEEVTGIGQLVLPALDGHLEEAPGFHHFGLSVGNLLGLVARVGGLQFGRFLLHGLDLFGEGEQIALEIVMFPLKAFHRIGIAPEVFAQSRLLLRDLREDLDTAGSR